VQIWKHAGARELCSGQKTEEDGLEIMCVGCMHAEGDKIREAKGGLEN
jgi:hypothetical protein